jgi:hypothetical protein
MLLNFRHYQEYINRETLSSFDCCITSKSSNKCKVITAHDKFCVTSCLIRVIILHVVISVDSFNELVSAMYRSRWLVLWSLWAARLVRQPTDTVRVSNGLVRGSIVPSGAYASYLGIPYATVTHRFQVPNFSC